MNKFVTVGVALGLGLVGGGLLSGCDTAPKTAGEKASLSSETDAALAAFKNADSSLDALLKKAAGYAVFPDVGKAGFIAGGAYGKGEVWEGGKKVGYADVSKGSVGLQIGAQTFSQLVVFMRKDQLDQLKANSFEFAADASAVAIKAGAGAAADYTKGVIVFTSVKGGLMAEASIGGQKFTYQAF